MRIVTLFSLVFALAIALLATSSASAATNCEPGTFQAAFFVEKNFKGQCVIKDVGAYLNSQSIGLPDNSISSIKFGPHTGVHAYADPLLEGQKAYYEGIQFSLNGMDNKISSLWVVKACHPGINEVALFTLKNYRGECVIRGVGNYANASQIGLPDNSISSIKVGLGVAAVLYANPNFNTSGGSYQFTNNVPDLDASPWMQNVTSSLRVRLR